MANKIINTGKAIWLNNLFLFCNQFWYDNEKLSLAIHGSMPRKQQAHKNWKEDFSHWYAETEQNHKGSNKINEPANWAFGFIKMKGHFIKTYNILAGCDCEDVEILFPLIAGILNKDHNL